jgi:hypothetical protein
LVGCLQEEAKRQQAEADRQQAEENAARARRQAEEDAIRARHARLVNLLSTSREDFLNLPTLVAAAEVHLDRAGDEFKDGAFAPFWDEVEHATNKLAAYHSQVQSLEQNALEYRKGVTNLPMRMPPFALPLGQLTDARPTAARLAATVRTAQKNFQFATIYEQRKTNQILVAGFGTLASAIYRMGGMISTSLSDLSGTLQVSLDRLLETATDDAMARREFEKELLDKQDDQAKMLKESLKKQDQQTRKLDDIHRRRKPLL